jgi:hypothetical protein
MAQVILLSEATLKQRSILQDNVDMKVVSPAILDVQEEYILPILGTSLYNDLLEQVRTNTLTNDYRTLLDDYITRCMIWYCKFELPMDLTYKYFNKSVGVMNAENMNAASMDELQYVLNRAKNKAEWYAERLTKFLLSNPTKYPLYLNQPNAQIDTIFAKRTNYTSGLSLGDGDCCMGDYNFKGIRIDRGQFQDCKWC